MLDFFYKLKRESIQSLKKAEEIDFKGSFTQEMNTRSLDKMAFVYIALVQNNFVILRVEDIAIACAFSRH